MLVLPVGLLGAAPAALDQVAASCLLDGIADLGCALAAWRLRSDWLGECLRVRRSLDNDELDIGFVGTLLDTMALTSFCAGGDGFVTKVYDQSGAGADASQPFAAAQPRIVGAGVVDAFPSGRPGIRFGGAQVLLASAALGGDTSLLAAMSRAAAVAASGYVEEVMCANGVEFNAGNGYGPVSDAGKVRLDASGHFARGWLNGLQQSSVNPFDSSTGAGEGAGIGLAIDGLSPTTGVDIGRLRGTGYCLSGLVGAVAIVNGSLPDAQMAALTLALQGMVS